MFCFIGETLPSKEKTLWPFLTFDQNVRTYKTRKNGKYNLSAEVIVSCAKTAASI
jgi:hypothetical protein